MELELVNRFERLAEVERDWEALLVRSKNDVPTSSPIWLGSWWRIFGGRRGRRLCTALFWEDGRLVGLAPLLRRKVGLTLGFDVERIELLASGEQERNEICSDYIGPIIETGLEQRVCIKLADSLYAGVFGGWDELLMQSMDASTVAPPLLAANLRPGSVRYAVTHASPYIPLPKSFEDYLAALPSQGRYLLRKSLRDLEAWSKDVQFHVATNLSELERGRKILECLHAERWNAAGKPGAFDSVRFRAFHDQIMRQLLERGALELCWLTAGGEPIAALYNIVWDGRVYFYQGGRSLRVPKKIRPGIVAHAFAIRRAIELGRREYDFLAGNARYKLDLALDFHAIATLYATERPLIPRLKHVAGYVRQELRRGQSWLSHAAQRGTRAKLADAGDDERTRETRAAGRDGGVVRSDE